MLFHPDIYFKDCEECRQFVMVDGEPHLTPEGKKIPRREGEQPNCKMCEKNNVPMLSERNWYTWEMYKRHKHFGLEPHERKDPLVQKHMIMIGEIDQAARMSVNPMMGLF